MTSVSPTLAPRNTPVQVLCTEEACMEHGGHHTAVVLEDVMHYVTPIKAVDKSYSVHADRFEENSWKVWVNLRGQGTLTAAQAHSIALQVATMEERVARLNAAAGTERG